MPSSPPTPPHPFCPAYPRLPAPVDLRWTHPVDSFPVGFGFPVDPVDRSSSRSPARSRDARPRIAIRVRVAVRRSRLGVVRTRSPRSAMPRRAAGFPFDRIAPSAFTFAPGSFGFVRVRSLAADWLPHRIDYRAPQLDSTYGPSSQLIPAHPATPDWIDSQD